MRKISLLFLLSIALIRAQPSYSIEGRVEGRMIDDIHGQAIQNVRLVLSAGE